MKEQEHEFVSGPVNVVRLEGKIGDANKVLYAFFDFHMDLNQQKQCSSIDATPVTQYFVKKFREMDNSDTTYDFFLEAYPSSIQRNNHNYSSKYIMDLMRLFSKVFGYDYKKNTVLRTKEFNNTRFHYIDIRDYLDMSSGYSWFNELDDYVHSIPKYGINYDDIEQMKNLATASHNIIMFINEVLFKKGSYTKSKYPVVLENPEKLYDYTDKEMKLIIQHMIEKIKTSKNKDVNGKINGIINGRLKKMINELNSTFKQLMKLLDESEKKLKFGYHELVVGDDGEVDYFVNYSDLRINILHDITTLVGKICHEGLYIGVLLVDLYFLRRFLDKDYITNGIIYTGASHSLNYIDILTKEFGFKITHASYSKYPMNKINDKLNENLRTLFWPPVFDQCSDMSSFPELFK